MYCHRLPKSLFTICVCALLLSGCAGNKTALMPAATPAATPATTPAATPAATPTPSGLTEQELQEVVARVNGREITRGEFERSKKILQAGQPGMKIPLYLQKDFDKQALDQLVNSELLYQAGQKLEVTDLEKNAEAKLALIKSGFADEKAYARELEYISMTESMLLDYSRRDLVIANFVDTRLAADLKVSDEEIRKFYDENPEKFLQQEQVRVSHILIGVDAKAGADEKKNAREKAERLQKELAGGAEFAVLAKEHSTCPSAKEGGDLGYFGKGKMVPPFEQAAFALHPAQISSVVETGFGYHILKQTGRLEAEVVPLDLAAQKIEAFLMARKVSQATAAFVGEARQDAKIELLLK